MAEIRTAIPEEVDAYLDALVQKGVFSNKAELVRAALVSYVNVTGTFFRGFDAENVFAPDGRLYQVEYARESAARGGTAAGIACEDGVLLAAEIPGKSKLSPGGKKIQSLGEHLAVVSAGLVGEVDDAQRHVPLTGHAFEVHLGVGARRHEGRRSGVLRGIEPPLRHAGGLLRKDRGEAPARAGTQRVLVVGQDLEDLQVPNEFEGLSRRLVHLRHAGHVARVVEGDLLRQRLREGDPLLPDQLLDVVGDVEDAVRWVATPLLVVPRERPVAFRTRRDEDLRAGLFHRVHVVRHELFLRRLLVAHPR